MSAIVVIKCDGFRNAAPCRGSFPSRWMTVDAARDAAARIGWRRPEVDDDDDGDICPSGGHDRDIEGSS